MKSKWGPSGCLQHAIAEAVAHSKCPRLRLRGEPDSQSLMLCIQEAARLREENSRLKQKLRRYVDALSNPAALAQMTDGGLHVSCEFVLTF